MKVCDVILTESARQRELEQMMEPVARAYELKGINNTTKKTIRDVREIFPDEEGMVWYLRWMKVMKLYNLTSSPRISNEEEIGRIYRREKEKLERAMGRSVSDSEIGMLIPAKGAFRHYLSLPIPEIQDYDYRGKNPSEVLEDFEELESEWQAERNEQIHYDGEEVIMDFGDGFAWYDLGKAACDAEGDAMGHCGNAPTADHPNETIFSLRKEVGKEPDGTVILKPFLTFIFNKNTGMFGEMKGRGNQKPADRYHKYIVPLLRDNIVRGIKGGGYLPENNFSILDLSNWKQLYQEKPALLPPQDYVREFGVDDFLISQASFQNADEEHSETVVYHVDAVFRTKDVIEYNFLRSENAVELLMGHRHAISFIVRNLLNSSQQTNFIERMREEAENRTNVGPINNLKDAIDFFDYDSKYNVGIFKHDILPLLEREHPKLISETADALFSADDNPLNISLRRLPIGAEDSIGEEFPLLEISLEVPIGGAEIPSFEYDRGTFTVEFSKKFIISSLLQFSDAGIHQIFIDDTLTFSAVMDSAGIMITIADEYKEVVAANLGSEIVGIMAREMDL